MSGHGDKVYAGGRAITFNFPINIQTGDSPAQSQHPAGVQKPENTARKPPHTAASNSQDRRKREAKHSSHRRTPNVKHTYTDSGYEKARRELDAQTAHLYIRDQGRYDIYAVIAVFMAIVRATKAGIYSTAHVQAWNDIVARILQDRMRDSQRRLLQKMVL